MSRLSNSINKMVHPHSEAPADIKPIAEEGHDHKTHGPTKWPCAGDYVKSAVKPVIEEEKLNKEGI